MYLIDHSDCSFLKKRDFKHTQFIPAVQKFFLFKMDVNMLGCVLFFNFTLTKIIKYWSLFWIIIYLSIHTQKASELFAALYSETGVNWRDVFYFWEGYVFNFLQRSFFCILLRFKSSIALWCFFLWPPTSLKWFCHPFIWDARILPVAFPSRLGAFWMAC